MKLTAAIAMNYPNAKVTMSGYDDPIFKIDEIDFKHDEFTLMRVSNGDIFHEPIGKCQLLLTPLSKISDEDAVEVAKIAIGDSADGYRFIVHDSPNRYGFKGDMHTDIKCVGVEWFCKHPDIMEYRPMYLIQIDTVDFDIVKGYYNPDDGYKDDIPDNMVTVIDYIRSKGYDCGHGSIPNLIAAGVAVEKK